MIVHDFNTLPIYVLLSAGELQLLLLRLQYGADIMLGFLEVSVSNGN